MNYLSVNRARVLYWNVVAVSSIGSIAMAAGDAPGRVSAVSGRVEIVQNGGKSRVVVGREIQETDKIETGPGGVVQIRFTDGSSFTLYEKSSVRIDQYRKGNDGKSTIDSAIDITYGKLRFFVNPAGTDKKNAKFKTKTAVMGIRGTSGIIDASPSGQTQLVVLTGKVEVFNPKFPTLPVMVGPNSLTSVNPGAVPNPPVAVTKEVINSIVPTVSEGEGFSDDSAAASGTPSSVPAPAGETKPKSEDAKDAPAEKLDGVAPQEKLDGAAPQEKQENLPKEGEGQGKVSPTNKQSIKTLFSPGGEVIKQESSGGLSSELPKAGNNSSAQSGGAKKDEKASSALPPLSSPNSESSPAVDVIRQMERTTSQMKSTIEVIEKKAQTNIIATPVATPTVNKIKVRINLPNE